MTSTPVKDVGSAFMNLTASQGSKSAAEGGDFLKVWSNQMSMEAQSNTARNGLPQGNVKQADASVSQKADVNKTDEGQIQQKDSTDMNQETAKASPDKEVSDVKTEQPEQTDELSPEELEEAMEVLNTAAAEFMQQIADVFGISMEELQAAMEDLGMDMTDVLDASKLSVLVLNLGGAEDSYALVTDETLYGNYQELMGSLNETLKDVSEKLDMDPGEAALLLEKVSVKEETVSTRAEELKDMPVDVEVSDSVELKAAAREMPVQETQNQPADEQTDGQTGRQEAQDGTQSQTGQIHRQVRQEGDKPDREQPVTMFSQHLESGRFEPEVQQSGSIPQNTGWSADTQNIMNQIMDYMKLQLNADSTSLEMQLHPASLGSIQIQLASKAGVVTANFIAQNEAVKTAIESQISQLKESFEEQGVKVEAIEVTVQTHEFERNLEQGRGRQQQEPEKKSRVRRINLDNPMSMEDLNEEEALAADMLAASGSTVEFTA